VKTHDVYTLVGPGNAAVAFEGLLQTHAVLPAGGHYVASIEGPGYAQASTFDVPDDELSVALSIVPGDTFMLVAFLSAYGDQSIQPLAPVVANGTIRFRGLPAGYSIVSCQNYDLPTPALPATWGGVKALYR
jgi:hypothetical protein